MAFRLGSVVAERKLLVHASRRRKDPRKTTIGRRAWCGLGVSPALVSGWSRELGEGSKHRNKVSSARLAGRIRGARSQQANVGSKTRSAERRAI